MLVLGYSLAVLMGLSLGMIGAGGSILTVPIFVYIFHIQPIVATGYSLLVVGVAAAYGGFQYWRQGQVNIATALGFVVPAMASVLLTRIAIVPHLPATLIGIPKDTVIMLLFAMIMFIAAIFMLKPSYPEPKRATTTSPHAFKLISSAIIVGLITGFVGAGGGFLIVPILVRLLGLKMQQAIGTSLAIIAINALVGFNGDMSTGLSLNISLLFLFISFTLVGIYFGTVLGRKLHSDHLKTIFAITVIILSLAIAVREISSFSV